MKRLFAILMIPVMFITGCLWKTTDDETNTFKWAEGAILKIGDNQIDFREGVVYLDATKKQYEQLYGTDIWNYRIKENGDTLGVTVKEEVLESIIYVKVVCAKANEMNVYLTQDELGEVDAKTDAYMKTLEGSSLEEAGINREYVRRVYSDNALARKTFECASLDVDTNIPNEIAGQHHFYSIALRNYKIGTGGEHVAYTDEEKQNLKNRLTAMMEASKAYKDFYSYAKSKTEDLKLLDVMAGKGDLDPLYEDKLMALKDGEFSDIIETEDYMYIFYCKTAFDRDATQEKKEEIIAERQREEFEKLYTVWRKEIGVEVNTLVWNSIEVFTVTKPFEDDFKDINRD